MCKQKFTSFFDVFLFGKFKDQNLNLIDVIEMDPKYVIWLYENDIIEIDNSIQSRFERELGYE